MPSVPHRSELSRAVGAGSRRHDGCAGDRAERGDAVATERVEGVVGIVEQLALLVERDRAEVPVARLDRLVAVELGVGLGVGRPRSARRPRRPRFVVVLARRVVAVVPRRRRRRRRTARVPNAASSSVGGASSSTVGVVDHDLRIADRVERVVGVVEQHGALAHGRRPRVDGLARPRPRAPRPRAPARAPPPPAPARPARRRARGGRRRRRAPAAAPPTSRRRSGVPSSGRTKASTSISAASSASRSVSKAWITSRSSSEGRDTEGPAGRRGPRRGLVGGSGRPARWAAIRRAVSSSISWFSTRITSHSAGSSRSPTSTRILGGRGASPSDRGVPGLGASGSGVSGAMARPFTHTRVGGATSPPGGFSGISGARGPRSREIGRLTGPPPSGMIWPVREQCATGVGRCSTVCVTLPLHVASRWHADLRRCHPLDLNPWARPTTELLEETVDHHHR